jgi:hypothetical protein
MRSLLFALVMSVSACSSAFQHTPPPVVAKPQPQPQTSVDREKLRAALAERRQLSFGRFLSYREARVYPRNTYQPGSQHVWLDEQGHLCAAATIISGDWGRTATEAVAIENNFIALADVNEGPLADWILTSGLTHAEIVAIQVPPMEWDGPPPQVIEQPEPDPGQQETARLYNMYMDIERQVTGLWEENLDLATDALMKRPDLARALISGVAAGPGRFAKTTREPVASDAGRGFAQPPPG